MMRFLLYTETKAGRVTGAVVDVPRRYSSDDYRRLQERFERDHRGWFTAMIRLHDDQQENGVFYDWGLQGPGGAWFLMIRLPDTTERALREAKNRIRAASDVVSMRTLKVAKMVDWSLAE